MILVTGSYIYDLRKARGIIVFSDEIIIEWGWGNEERLDEERITLPEELSKKEIKNLTSLIARYKNSDVVYSLDQLIEIAKQDNIDFEMDTR